MVEELLVKQRTELQSMSMAYKTECDCLQVNSPFHSSWKVTKLLHETEAKVEFAQLEKCK